MSYQGKTGLSLNKAEKEDYDWTWGLPKKFDCIGMSNDDVSGKLGQLNKGRNNMDMSSAGVNFGVVQPSIERKPTKIVGKGNQKFNRGGRELTTDFDLITS